MDMELPSARSSSPAETPSHRTKRPRTETDYSLHTQDPAYYFPDGNICLVADQVIFKVHQGILARHCTVFRNMFGVPELTEGDVRHDGVRVVPLTDNKDDLRVFLRLIYDSP